MKIITGQDSKNQHVIAIEHDREIRCFLKHYSSQATTVALCSLNRDIARHGNSFVLDTFKSLPLVNLRISKGKGVAILDVIEDK